MSAPSVSGRRSYSMMSCARFSAASRSLARLVVRREDGLDVPAEADGECLAALPSRSGAASGPRAVGGANPRGLVALEVHRTSWGVEERIREQIGPTRRNRARDLVRVPVWKEPASSSSMTTRRSGCSCAASCEHAGGELVEAPSGQDGLRALFDVRPHIVVLDLSMPGLDGWQTLERIRQITDVPVVMLSARADELEKVRALQAGADDYVTKPFGTQELLARLQAHLRRATTPAHGRARGRPRLHRRGGRRRLRARRGDRRRPPARAHAAGVPPAQRLRAPPAPHPQPRAAPVARLGRPHRRRTAREGLRRLPARQARRRGPGAAADRDRARLRLPLPAARPG